MTATRPATICGFAGRAFVRLVEEVTRAQNPTMPTFIDESGDTGQVARGGKPYFRLAAVWVPTLDDAATLRDAIRQARLTLSLRPNYEFKWADTTTRHTHRQEFFNAALTVAFRFAVCSINKTTPEYELPLRYWAGADGPEMHWACATTLAVLLRTTYEAQEASCPRPPLREPVVVDSNKDAAYLDVVATAFRGLPSLRCPTASLVGPVRFRNSSPDEMLHLADMVCGAVGSHLDGRGSAWYHLIAARSLGVLCLP
jgi:hypothetical protein